MKNTLLLAACLLSLGANAQTITTIAGTGFSGFTGDGVAAAASGVYLPYDVGMDSLGNIYVGDVGNNRIRKISTSGVISTIAGSGTAGYNGDGVPATTAHLNFPYGMSVNQGGSVVISDMDNNRVRLIQTAEGGGAIYTIAGTGVAGFSGDGGPAVAAQVHDPQGIFWDVSGNVYFADAENHRVRKISGTGIITTIAGNGSPTTSGDGGPATAAGVNHPSGIFADPAGNIYIAEMYGQRIRKINTSGIISTVAGNGIVGYSGDGGPATAASIRYPKGVCIDRLGNLLFTDTDNLLIRKVNTTTGIITTIAGIAGVAAYGGDGGPATAAKLNYPQGIYSDKNGHIYIGDCGNNRVRKIECTPPAVAAITGPDTVCVGSTITVSSATSGGTWTSVGTHTSVSGGVVTGITVGADTIKYSVSNSCTTTLVKRVVYVKTCPPSSTLGIGSVRSTTVRISPNPATNEVIIASEQTIKQLSLTNIAGQTVYEGTFNRAIVPISIAHLAAGTYFVKVNGQPAGQFVKQ